MASKTITIYDIAKEAEVSPATVSRVLTGSAVVSAAKYRRVKELIDKYNFQPNALARSLIDTHTKTIGLLVADIRNPYYARLVVECELAANELGYTVVMSNALDNDKLEENCVKRMLTQQVDAIIQIGGRVDKRVSDPAYSVFMQNFCHVPFITTGRLDGVADCYRIYIDDADAMQQIFDHLVSLGHNNIAFIGGQNSVQSTYDKWRYYIYQLGRYNLVFREENVIEGNYSENGGFICMNRLFDIEKKKPTAVIAVNDYTAVGALRAASERGVRIPEDLSLVSFDNTFLSEIVKPKLTSVDYNYTKYGKVLIDTTVEAIQNSCYLREQTIKTNLIIRQSTGNCE
jgi:DNA-binding LacI/PurR family transcriptional regulator